MIKTNIDITKEEIKEFIDRRIYVIDMQIRSDVEPIYNDIRDIFINTIYTDDPKLGKKVDEIPNPEFDCCFYVLGGYKDCVGFALEEDEIGYFFEIFCLMPEYYEHLVKFYNAVNEKGYPVWVKNGQEIAAYLKKKYEL